MNAINKQEEQTLVANLVSLEEIEHRENAASDTFMCCIVNVAF